MNKKLLIFALIYTIILVIISGLMISYISGKINEQSSGESYSQTVSVGMNEVKQLISSGDTDGAIEKCDEIRNISSDAGTGKSSAILLIWILTVINIIAMVIVLIYVNHRILKPFDDMKEFAGEIAKGNMNVNLEMDRENYFGDFTWAFENMRKEIVKSRNAEKTAIENNKTVIATLSHDIKTPVASIRAYAEAFEANMDNTPEKRQKYLGILMQKCDEVTKLTNDLFLHSISEMNRLEVKEESVELVTFLENDVRELFVDSEEVEIIIPEVLLTDSEVLSADSKTASGEVAKGLYVNADRKRLLQIMENLKNNADKYAKTKISITLEVSEEGTSQTTKQEVRIHFRDYGPGIPEEEIPFITGKFYRGKNAGKENGSGLGLYIVKELAEKMNGHLQLINKNPGLDAVLTFF